MARKLKAIIAGAGFGGLTAAAALAQRGWEVVVYERQPEVRAAGSGIYVWENGLRVLDAIGAAIPHHELFRGRAIEQRNHLNQVIDEGRLPPDMRLVTIPRKELLNAIRDAAEKSGVTIETGSEVIGATAMGELQFAAGRSETADLAIGADGVWSIVRKALGLEFFHGSKAPCAPSFRVPRRNSARTAGTNTSSVGTATGDFLSLRWRSRPGRRHGRRYRQPIPDRLADPWKREQMSRAARSEPTGSKSAR
jgi:flavin-dependent dehydrogenase